MSIPTEIRDALLDGSHTSRFVVDGFYSGKPTEADIPVSRAAGSISQARSSKIRDVGRLYVISDLSAATGRTLEPRTLTDALAPFGQELDVRLEVSLGSRVVGSVSIGRYVIDEIPDTSRTARKITNGTFVEEGAHIEVAFSGQLSRIEENDFTQVSAPASGASSWAEFRRLSTLPVIVSELPDKPLNESVVYDKSRLTTLERIAQHLGGLLHVTRQGALTIRPEFPALPYDLENGPVDVDLTGTIRDMSNSFSRSISNRVVLTTSQSRSEQMVATAEITDGPLAVTGPLGPRVHAETTSLAMSQAQLNDAAQALLVRVSSSQAKTVKVSCLPNPEVELGHVARAVDPSTNRMEVGIVDRIDWSLNPTDLFAVTLLIPNEVIPWA